MMDNESRMKKHMRNDRLEALLSEINLLLSPVEQACVADLDRPQLPILFIVGCSRCGSTLLYQWLAATGLFAYPSNIISRFYDAPYIGSLIHKIFIDYDSGFELCGKDFIEFRSFLGKTRNAVAPHEFWYFWRRFFKFTGTQELSPEERARMDVPGLLKELASMEQVFQKPLLFKAIMMNWHIDILYKIFKTAIFLFIRRNEIDNMASLYNARIDFYDDCNKWYSFKPPEYVWLKNDDVYGQLAGQVYFTNKQIERSLEQIPTQNKMCISYADLCQKPRALFEEITQKLEKCGYAATNTYEGSHGFDISTASEDKGFDVKRAQKAWYSLAADPDNYYEQTRRE
jgi:hypothetical protein